MFTLSSRPTRTKTGLSRDHRLGRFHGIRETFYISSLQSRRLLTETKRYIDRGCHFEKPRKRLREEGRGGEKNHFPFMLLFCFLSLGVFQPPEVSHTRWASWNAPPNRIGGREGRCVTVQGSYTFSTVKFKDFSRTFKDHNFKFRGPYLLLLGQVPNNL